MKTKLFVFAKRRLQLLLIDSLFYICLTALYWIFTLVDKTQIYDFKKYIINSVILLAILITARMLFRVYRNVWRYMNTFALLSIVVSDLISCALAVGGLLIVNGFDAPILFPQLWHVGMVCALFSLMTVSSRFCYRLRYKSLTMRSDEDSNRIKVAIVGAGQLGFLLAEELNANKNSHYKPLFFIDSDPVKQNSRVAGLDVFYDDDNVKKLISEYGVQEIFIALSNVDGERSTRLYEYYSSLGCKVKIYDTPVKDMSSSDDTSQKRTLREFRIEDLLFRKSIVINNKESLDFYSGKTVLVTGGGGSIGSEICRQIAACKPKRLIIFDIYENNAYDIQQELISKYGEKLDLCVEIGSVRDTVRLDTIFRIYRPDVVFHAAAHKHVPLMEHSCGEAIKNNVFGTKNVADMAEKYGTGKFILISTDKAVNPTNIMGASKRMCEQIVLCRNDSKTSFAAVRFGNVLGSNGSVIPLFKHQIEAGGPITITDKRIIRYFMTIGEASQLVLQAGSMAKRGELFVLDMGKPVKIYDLAINMIKLSGLEPDKDIEIREIGLRHGEKLYEELLIKTETLSKTANNLIFIETETPPTREEVDKKLELLAQAVNEGADELTSSKIKSALMQAVPTFHDPEYVNKTAEQSEEMKQTMK